MDLESKIDELPRIGKVTASKFKKLGINKVKDLIFHFPFRYDDFSQITPIKDLTPDTNVNIIGFVELIQNRRTKNKRMNITEALIKDDTGEVKVIWFNQPFVTNYIKTGDKVSLAGKTKQNPGEIILNSPEYEKINANNPNLTHTGGLIPHYHSTEKLTQKQIRFRVKSVLPLIKNLEDWLPENIKENLSLLDLDKALEEIHFPTDNKNLRKAKERLSFDELFLIQLKSQLIKKDMQKLKAAPLRFQEEETKQFVRSLPFNLTDAQRRSAWEIIKDLGEDKPMTRLLEGDVGSGKTLVAVIAMLNVSLNKDFSQSALMVPTEVLAGQHFNSISETLNYYDKNKQIKVGLITKDKKKINYTTKNWEKISKKKKIDEITDNCHIIIGTHSLIQEDVTFKNLNFAIIDEQHRFGVGQRKALMNKSGDKNTSPHLLSMTATPIPRTLALALFGELDISIIDQLPADRKPIVTKLVGEEKRNNAYSFIKKEIENGRQIFVICPLIDPSDKLGVKSSNEEYEKLKNKIFPDKKIGMLHGKMRPKEKEEIMQEFLDKKYDILVSTSVVEVGVDVPNASIMVIEGADRFGLSQLHQFRGRVGRGAHQSYCLLFTESDSAKTRERLEVMEKYSDGFTLSKMDLKFRGSGEIYGTNQKGFPELKIADLLDYKLMKDAQAEAIKLVEKDPELVKHPLLKEKMDSWVREIHLE